MAQKVKEGTLRRLTIGEIALARQVFGSLITYYNVISSTVPIQGVTNNNIASLYEYALSLFLNKGNGHETKSSNSINRYTEFNSDWLSSW